MMVSGGVNGVSPDDITEVTTLVRRAVAGRVADRDAVDEIVQETLARLLAAKRRLDGAALGPYAIIVARNLVATHWRRIGTNSRHEHRLFEPPSATHREDDLLAQEECVALRAALERLQPIERQVLVEHELDGRDTKSLAIDLGSTPGAIAAQLNAQGNMTSSALTAAAAITALSQREPGVPSVVERQRDPVATSGTAGVHRGTPAVTPCDNGAVPSLHVNRLID